MFLTETSKLLKSFETRKVGLCLPQFVLTFGRRRLLHDLVLWEWILLLSCQIEVEIYQSISAFVDKDTTMFIPEKYKQNFDVLSNDFSSLL